MVIISFMVVKSCKGRTEHKQKNSYQEVNNSCMTVIENTSPIKSQYSLCRTDPAFHLSAV